MELLARTLRVQFQKIKYNLSSSENPKQQLFKDQTSPTANHFTYFSNSISSNIKRRRRFLLTEKTETLLHFTQPKHDSLP